MIALAATFADRGVDWVVAGSTGRALAGFAVTPRDLDVEVDEGSVHRAAAAAGLRAAREADASIASVRARGTWHGVELDVSGGLTLHGPGGSLAPDFALLRGSAKPVDVGGRTVWVAPVEEQIARSLVAGDERQLDRIAEERPGGFEVDDLYLAARLAAASASR